MEMSGESSEDERVAVLIHNTFLILKTVHATMWRRTCTQKKYE
jgi:hypothetical protein